MLNWIKFFFTSFFSNKRSKEAVRRGYSNLFLALILALVYLCVGLIGADVLPFGKHYDNASSFKDMARSAFMYPDGVRGVDVLIEKGELKARINGEFEKALVVDTFNSEEDRQTYSRGGYQLVIDTRSADTLAEIEATCVSTDEQKMVISYEDYLTLNEVARKNFEFKLKYTGKELVLDDLSVVNYKAFVDQTNDQNKELAKDLSDKYESGDITKEQYNRGIYELYFTAYYPEITEYESTSKVPLLRNYYFHELIDNGEDKFLMVFDDCMVGSFETDGGIDVFFYGVYDSLPDGKLIEGYYGAPTRINAVDDLIIKSYKATVDLSTYIYIMNTIRLVPIVALMGIVVAMLMHSILSLKGVETCRTFGASLKVVGSYVWFSGLITAILTVVLAFILQKNLITMISLVVFFVTLLARTIVFALKQIKERKIELEKLVNSENQPTDNTEA
ncbi:MAG: hypothetical protein E7382_01710 [Clostridiales bacterium]|nr:hypothetical protein [Clostridiales bacterium]